MCKQQTIILQRNVFLVFIFSLLLFFVSPLQLFAQDQNVALRGFVRDAEVARPLPGANILLKALDDSTQIFGAVAGSNGHYAITELSHGSYAIRVSFIGYQTLYDTLHFYGRENQFAFTAELFPSKHKMEEVIITGKAGGATTLEAGRQTITPRNLGRVPTPSISGDLAIYLKALPGVVSTGDRGGKLFIRGGAADQNLVLMDKIQIYRPFHILGFYSIFSQDLISNAQVYAGGFPAKYSGRLSSVIDVTMRGGNQQQFEGAATVGPFLTGFRLEGPIDHERSFLIAGRFSQIERTAPVFLGKDLPLKFGDQLIKLQKVNDQALCSFTALHTYDRGKIDVKRNDVFRWSNYGLGGRCVTLLGGASFMDASVSASYGKNSVGGGGEGWGREASIWNITTGVNLTFPLKKGNSINGGFKSRIVEASYDLNEKFTANRVGKEVMIAYRTYFSLNWHIGSNLDITPGLSLGGTFGWFSLEPRLRFAWRPFGNESEELNAAFGIYRQHIVGLSDERDIGSSFTAWVPAQLGQGHPQSVHMILGWSQEVGDFGLTVEGYHKRISNLTVPIWSTFARFTTRMTSADGTVWGFDLRGEFRRGPVYAYIGYGFSWTQYETSQEHLSTGSQFYHPAHDRRHSLNALFSADLGFANLDIQWQFGSGLPYTRPFGFDSLIPLRDLQDPRDEYGTPRVLFKKPYQGRLPVYHRLDVSLGRTFDLGLGNLTVKAGAMNIYNRQNLFYYDLFRLRRVDQLPLVPFIAVEIAT